MCFENRRWWMVTVGSKDRGPKTEDRGKGTGDGSKKTSNYTDVLKLSRVYFYKDYYLKLEQMKFKFENLEIWKKAMDLGEVIDRKAFDFPKRELYALSSHIRRASDSIGLNIAEGSVGQSNLEQKRFISYAIRSLAEVVACLYKAKNRTYISIEEFDQLYSDSFSLMNMMIAFKKSIQ